MGYLVRLQVLPQDGGCWLLTPYQTFGAHSVLPKGDKPSFVTEPSGPLDRGCYPTRLRSLLRRSGWVVRGGGFGWVPYLVGGCGHTR